MNALRLLPAAAALALVSCSSVWGSAALSERFHQSIAARGLAHVEVVNVSGSIAITAVPGSTLTVDAIKRGYSPQALSITRVSAKQSGDTLQIRTTYDRAGWFARNDGANVDYTIAVPFGLSINVRNVNGDLTLTDHTADIDAKDVNGNVRIALGRVGGSRRVRASVVNGDVNVAIDPASDTLIDAATVTGSIHTPFALAVSKGFVGESARGFVGHAGGSMHLNTVNGNITVLQQNATSS